MHLKPITLAAMLTAASVLPVTAQTATTGSSGCSTLYQAAADTVTNRIAADDNNIPQPQSVKTLTCLDNFFHGTGLDIIANILNPEQLFQTLTNQICNAISQAWQNSIGAKQCGITLTGFQLGTFHGLGGGFSCPRLAFGGGGPQLGTFGIGTNGSGKFYVTGNALPPTGYPLPTNMGLW